MDMPGMNPDLERDGGSEGEAMSTEGSSAASMYCSLEQDFARIMNEMKTNESLAMYEAEYTRLYEALYKSNQLGVELNAKVSELKEVTTSNSETISVLEAQTKADAKKIQELNRELLEQQQLADVAHTREQRAQEVIGNLRVSINKLSDELELKNKQLAVDDMEAAQKQKDGSKDRDVLLQEIDTLKHRVKSLETYNAELDLKLGEAEALATELQDKMGKLENDLNKERREREKCEFELQAAFEDRRQRMIELQTAEETLKTTLANYRKHEHILREQVTDNDIKQKQIKRLNFKIQSTQNELERQHVKSDNLKKELFEHSKIIKEMTVDLERQKDSVTKAKSEKDLIMKKLVNEKELNAKYKMDLDQTYSILNNAEREIMENKKTLDANRKAFYNLSKERDVAFKNNANLEEIKKKLTIELKIMEQNNRKMEASLESSMQTIVDLGRQMKKLEGDRDRCHLEAQELTNKVEDYMDEVKTIRLQIADYQKRLIEADAKYRQQMSLFEEVRAERNNFKKNFSLAQEEIMDLRSKLRNVSLQNDKLQTLLMDKNDELQKQEFIQNRLEKEKDSLMTELENCRKDITALRKQLEENHQEEKRLRQRLKDNDLQMDRQKKEIQSVMNERDIVNTQIVRRNDELNLQYSKSQILTETLSRGEKQYSQRLDEIRMLKLEVKKLRIDNAALVKHTADLNDLRGEVFSLERDLTKERLKVVALEEEMQNPLNIHRWRNLEGTDPDSFEQLTKIQFLQKRILKMSSEMIAKEKQIKHTEKLYMNLREIVAKQPGPDVLVSLSKTRKALRDRGKKMKCLVAELNMSMKNEHKFEIDKIKKELKSVKAKFYAQKKKCTSSIAPEVHSSPRVTTPHKPVEQIDSNKLQEAADAEKVKLMAAHEEKTKL